MCERERERVSELVRERVFVYVLELQHTGYKILHSTQKKKDLLGLLKNIMSSGSTNSVK